MIASLVTTYNRPEALARTIPQVARLGDPVLVVDDCSDDWKRNREICIACGVLYLRLPENRGLAGALNVGFSFYFADSEITHISYFQDDVDVHPDAHKILDGLKAHAPLLSGHDAPEHGCTRELQMNGGGVKLKKAIRATHMFASVEFLHTIFPIPTRTLGAPKRVSDPGARGIGSNADWWIVRDAPRSIQNSGQHIICVPGLVRTFLWRAGESCWNNQQRGEDRPLGEF